MDGHQRSMRSIRPCRIFCLLTVTTSMSLSMTTFCCRRTGNIRSPVRLIGFRGWEPVGSIMLAQKRASLSWQRRHRCRESRSETFCSGIQRESRTLLAETWQCCRESRSRLGRTHMQTTAGSITSTKMDGDVRESSRSDSDMATSRITMVSCGCCITKTQQSMWRGARPIWRTGFKTQRGLAGNEIAFWGTIVVVTIRSAHYCRTSKTSE